MLANKSSEKVGVLGEEKENSSEVKVHDFTQNMEDKGVNKIDLPSKAVQYHHETVHKGNNEKQGI